MKTGIILVAGFTVVFLLVFVITNVMLGRIVLRPVRLMSSAAEKSEHGRLLRAPNIKKPGNDEISSLFPFLQPGQT